jgi:hypothetical protein
MKLEDLFEAESKANIARRIIRQVTNRSEFMQQAKEAGIDSPHTRQLYYSKFRDDMGRDVAERLGLHPSSVTASPRKRKRQITDNDLLKAVGDMLNIMKRQRQFNSNVDEPRMEGMQAVAGIRDWGRWENPHDAHDEQDYDWQVLTDQSRRELDKLHNQFSKQYPGIKFEFSTEEKNWIMLYASRK